MDALTFIGTLTSSGLISLGAARWLTKRIIDHRFTKDLKDYQAGIDENLAVAKAALDERVAKGKTELEAELRRDVEEFLGDQAAKRQYRLDAQKRLYTAIGPLRFQLLLASSDFAARIQRIGVGKQPYPISLAGYFGRSTIYRLLRVFGTAELIERQIAYADFSVDPSTARLLRFKRAAFRCLSSSTITIGHPREDWTKQEEHIFHDTLSLIGTALIVADTQTNLQRCMRFDEFDQLASDSRKHASIHPIPHIVEDFTVTSKPLFWLRLVALGRLCTELVAQEGQDLGIEKDDFNVARLLSAPNDEFITAHHERYRRMVEEVASSLITVGTDKVKGCASDLRFTHLKDDALEERADLPPPKSSPPT